MMMQNKNELAEEKFFKLMKRVRTLGLDTHSLENAPISPAQISLLDFIANSPGCNLQDVANGLRLTAPTVSVGIRKLEENRLVERKPHPLDGRSIQFFLTRRGQALQRQIQNSHLQKFQRLLAGLTNQEQETLLTLLERALQYAENDQFIPKGENF
jgi:DNA-binding MarR family transcriptional regulator